MNLVIDQGNTITKVALFEADTIVETFLYETFNIETCASLLSAYAIDNCVYCTVMEPLTEVLTCLDNNLSYFLFIEEGTLFPIKNEYKTPETLGKDRLAAVIEANALQPDRNLLVIDAGTAITYEFVDADNTYQGGNISPGLSMRFRALNAFTSKLPLVDRHGQLPDIGCDTETAIRVGVVKGVVNEITMYIQQYRAKHPEMVVVLTGGHALYLASLLDETVVVDVNLVLKGLNRILNHNVKK